MLLKNRRIFLVEDDLSNRAVAQLLLEKHGARTAIDRWGVETISRLRNFMPIDIILLDLMFPDDISGFDLFDEIRQELDLAHIPILAVSAMDPAVAIPKAQAKGFNGFIPKPVEYDLFAQQVADIIEGIPVWAGA